MKMASSFLIEMGAELLKIHTGGKWRKWSCETGTQNIGASRRRHRGRSRMKWMYAKEE